VYRQALFGKRELLGFPGGRYGNEPRPEAKGLLASVAQRSSRHAAALQYEDDFVIVDRRRFKLGPRMSIYFGIKSATGCYRRLGNWSSPQRDIEVLHQGNLL
jgi:hypothetical protein